MHMDKNTLVGIGALVVIIGGLVLYVGLRPSPAKAPTEDLPAALNGSYIEHADYYDIETAYPTETPLPGDANEAAVTLMQGWVIETVSQFKTDGNFDNLTAEDITVLGFDQGRKEALKITYTTVSSPRTVSYFFTVYTDTLGAHPNAFFKTFTFDTATGAALSLGDLFIPGAKYLDQLSTIARAKLPGIIGQYTDTDYIKTGTELKDENFQNFIIDKATLNILFEPYQVGPYAIGSQTLPIPLADLASILKSEYKP